ncbi:response regulator transcription factor [Roseisolibacter sp. H3M3-2]|uniref:response regulator transcription factor n=1 Tax=Roseisolibacter sp. H3M3-2 TaxID=3031323 RepID=UPI0023DC644E|nr:response regulator transcription factor [Roseisolibacter sp. H3M3-2]MDF1505092.1 response regulator transcription factor [Roseisolibacter sp. H3M3-2]
MRAPIRVLLADDHGVVRLGLRTLLGSAPDVEVVGEASDGHEALAQAERLAPDIVVMDLSMDGMDGVAATRELARRRGAGAAPRVLVLTMHDEEEYLIPLLEAGASGYVVKDAASTELLDALRVVASGRTYVRPSAAHVLAEGWTRRAQQDGTRARYDSLSERERAVFVLIAQGYTPSQIGERLNISAKTADTYRRRINDKMGFSERAEYVKHALELGLLTA